MMHERDSDRLCAEDWVEAGLKALAKGGFAALKAEALAKRLHVSRGSFYWHFADVAAFHDAVLARWRKKALERVIEEIDHGGGDRLRALLFRALVAPTGLEVAVRAWGVADPRARTAVKKVDARRRRYLCDLLRDAGVEPISASARADIIYFTYLGHVFSTRKLSASELARVVDDLSRLAISP
jgi:AcrR family transcriptional regulator